MFVRLISLGLIGLLVGCGFHLRNYGLEGLFESFAIVGKTRAQVVSPLRQSLQQLDISEVAPDEAEVVVEILEQRSERRSVSTSGQARAAEYEIDYAVYFRLMDGAGTVLAPAAWIERQRVYRIDRGNIVGSNQEQRLVQKEIVQDVAGQIVRSMDLVSRGSK